MNYTILKEHKDGGGKIMRALLYPIILVLIVIAINLLLIAILKNSR
jgi:type II secretory pathway component PulF